MKLHWVGAVLLALGGCAAMRPPLTVADAAGANWRDVATSGDMQRLRNWRTAFVTALAKARAAGDGPKIDAEGTLLQPDAARPDPTLPAGRYRCRVIKLGANGAAMLNYVAYPAFDCRVEQEGDVRGFTKVSGSQRPVGLIFKNDAMHDVFLGTLMLGDETQALEYGHDGERDLIGAVERIGERRWRMVFPYPRFESLLDVVELVPAAS